MLCLSRFRLDSRHFLEHRIRTKQNQLSVRVALARRNMEEAVRDKVHELLETANWDTLTERKLIDLVGRDLDLDIAPYSPLIKVQDH